MPRNATHFGAASAVLRAIGSILFERLLDASAALADRRRHGRVRTDGREGLGAAGLFRRGRMDAANVGSLAGLTSLGRVPPRWFSLFEQRDAFRRLEEHTSELQSRGHLV